jgi:pimeloyl-ACP methyl ester carboxylesterase
MSELIEPRQIPTFRRPTLDPRRSAVASRLLVLLALALCAGCATPVGVTSAGRNYGYAQIDRSALNSAEFSSYTAVVLHRHNMERMNAKSPTRCLTELHQRAGSDNRRDTLFALSELSFLLGKEGRRLKVNGRTLGPENFFAASAAYAYLFLLGPGEELPPDSFDRRFRIACDFYNRSLGYIIAHREGTRASGDAEWPLPVGSMVIERGGGSSDFDLPLKENETFVSADRFQIRGLSVRNRNAGLGAPIVIMPPKKVGRPMASGSAATVFLRIQGGLADLTAGTLRGRVEIYSAFARDHVEVDGRQVPLEEDLTTQIAYTLNNPAYWQVEKMLFRLGQAPFAPGIYPTQPYQPGKIPVLFVHGTMSSPVWWAEMWNTLMGDPTLRGKYQFWFYLYDSAKPIGQSAIHLRESIESTVTKMDPESKDPMLRQMVVIGHSQGGLLTKLTATHTGDALIRATTGKTLAELKLSPDEEKVVRRLAMFEPLPEVKRVVFISTPHRGSYQAGDFVRKLARRFLDLPKQALQTTAELLTIAPKIGPDVKLASTSLDNMSPDNAAMLALAEIPVAPPIKAHSIIAVKGGDIPPEGGDGVVKYTSAHVEGVESELVVRGGHSCQDKPMTIEEVRRILLEHLRRVTGDAPSPSAAPRR